MKKNIIIVLIIFLMFSIMYYFFFDINKIYNEYWNIYIPNPNQIKKTIYSDNISTTYMRFRKRNINKILEKNNFIRIDDKIYEIYNFIDKATIEKIGDLEEIINDYEYYILLKKEENNDLKFDLLLLNVERKQLLSINNCMYRI